MGLWNWIFPDATTKELKRITPMVARINKFEEEYQSFSEGELRRKTEEFRDRIANGESVDSLLPEAFAVVKNACRRLIGTKYTISGLEKTWNMIPFDVQLIGGLVMHRGQIAEMKTGEGKTLVCTLPVYLNALEGKGVHVITVNDYLARRDSEWMGLVYRFLGLSVGTVVHGLDEKQRKEAYSCDITYGTNNEFGFDYLRDNMVQDINHIVQRDLHYAIVDEVDSILVDEARTPLIISAPAQESTSKYVKYSQLIPRLKKDEDFVVDEKLKTSTLTEKGIANMEQMLGLKNIYTDAGFTEVHHIEQALRAQALFMLDRDYVVKDGEVVIVDEFTGRLMPGRRFSEGLHQALEAKEGVEVKRESKTLATITFQNYFRLYKKLAGMTGTAATEAEEFESIYNLPVISVPTHKPVTRKDLPDLVYKNERGKFMAVVREIKKKYEAGQPVLVGTISIERSEHLSDLLHKENVPHQVLNAKFHEKEAEIIALAGQKGAVTIATNMAGRGTDIQLGAEVVELGGLHVLGTERHESRRIDNQLRGRSGRQGDPGSSQFYVSMEDDLMRLFAGDRIKTLMERLNIPDDQEIENSMMTYSIESAQKRVEGRNFDIRKHVLQYDNVMNRHRHLIYARRRKILLATDLRADIREMLRGEIASLVRGHINVETAEIDRDKVREDLMAIHKLDPDSISTLPEDIIHDTEILIEKVTDAYIAAYDDKAAKAPSAEAMQLLEKFVCLRTIDSLWMDHLDHMQYLREKVSLKAYGQRDPLVEYKQEAYLAMERLLTMVQSGIVHTIFKVDFTPQIQQIAQPINIMTNEQQIENQIEESSLIAKPQKMTTIRQGTKVDRNDPCPCGSGKKYKKCHGK
ncbi:MAG: preprotein translocase subunit SecA [Candidatus Abawacabacteria bacterium RBG_16_42_10]|uniref:Protein translocase subunit SecA n=1 Tax=Candidatus Abawacabacteria bacterium RBG_16_42_10 TaxID=1817814 RepID=A0A1F4XKL6_9BACT|nr:MAG: preprotein translocase subunit SecA [Candidatus Abawacabacteria bacterium RBG_16_42_10]